MSLDTNSVAVCPPDDKKGIQPSHHMVLYVLLLYDCPFSLKSTAEVKKREVFVKQKPKKKLSSFSHKIMDISLLSLLSYRA